MALPTFLVIGAARSGTTSLHHYLAQHPEVFVTPEKSPNFFVAHEPQPPWEGAVPRRMARQWVADRGEYEAIFDRAGVDAARGEVSPVYLQARSAPQRIRDVCPDARIVAILRDPAERAFAHFLGRRRDGLEPRDDFAAVVDDELSRPLPDDVAFGHYTGAGRYHHFLAEYLRVFPREQVRVHLFDDFRRDPRRVVADVYDFVGVDPGFPVDTDRAHGRTGEIRNPVARFAWTRSVRLRTALRPYLPARVRDAAQPLMSDLSRPRLDPALRARLVEALRPDVERLQALLDRDLGGWLRV